MTVHPSKPPHPLLKSKMFAPSSQDSTQHKMLHSMLLISKTLRCRDSTAYRSLAWQQKHQGSPVWMQLQCTKTVLWMWQSEHRGKTSTHAPGWAFPATFSVTLFSQIKISCARSASFCVQLVVQLFCFMLLPFLTILYLLKLLSWITSHRSLK